MGSTAKISRPREVADAAVEARRNVLSARRRGFTALALFVILLSHLQPVAVGAYTTSEAITRLVAAFATIHFLAVFAQSYYMTAAKRSIERRLAVAFEEDKNNY